MNNYSLINKNIIDTSKQKYSYSNIKEILDNLIIIGIIKDI